MFEKNEENFFEARGRNTSKKQLQKFRPGQESEPYVIESEGDGNESGLKKLNNSSLSKGFVNDDSNGDTEWHEDEDRFLEQIISSQNF